MTISTDQMREGSKMRLTVLDGSGGALDLTFDQAQVLVGRDDKCDVVVDDERVSRSHARLSVTPSGAVHIQDLGSTNGTWVNGIKIVGPVPVIPGDEIRVGKHTLLLVADGRPGAVTVLAGRDEPWPASSSPSLTAGPQPVPSGAAPQITGQGGDRAGATGGAGGLGTPGPFAAPSRVPAGLVTSPPRRPSTHRRRRNLVGAVTAVAVAFVVTLVAVRTARGPSTMSPAHLISAWGPSTLYVLVDQGGESQVSGTAWVLDAKAGLVVTNAHVVDAGNDYRIGQGPDVQPASLVAVSVCDDLAVLRVSDTTGLRNFRLATQSQVRSGEPVTALGYPADSAQTPSLAVTSGLVSVARTQFDLSSVDAPHYPDVIQTSAAINPGNSGGPLLDSRGRLIGVNTANLTSEAGRVIQGEGYAIGIDRARQVLAGLRLGHSVGFTGMDFLFPTAPGDFTSLGLPVTPGGIIVTGADPDSPAANAGFNDEPAVITSINGHALDGTLASYCQAVGGDTAGQQASFHVVLANRSSDTVTLPFA